MIGLRQTDIGFLCLAPVQPITGSVTGLCRGNVEGFLRGRVLLERVSWIWVCCFPTGINCTAYFVSSPDFQHSLQQMFTNVSSLWVLLFLTSDLPQAGVKNTDFSKLQIFVTALNFTPAFMILLHPVAWRKIVKMLLFVSFCILTE